jgi:hypothetical protein
MILVLPTEESPTRTTLKSVRSFIVAEEKRKGREVNEVR